MQAYLQFKAGPNGPFNTVAVPHKIEEMPYHKAGLTWTVTGYGKKIPSRHMIQYRGKWRRVYVTQYGNAGSAWIMVDGARVHVDVYS